MGVGGSSVLDSVVLDAENMAVLCQRLVKLRQDRRHHEPQPAESGEHCR
jgi:hypothetical protein